MSPALNSYSGYLFDLDGTLIDSAPDINAALNHALTRHGHAPVTEALTRHWVGHGSRTLTQQALDHHGAGHESLDSLLEAFLGYYEAHIADLSTPYPGVTTALQRLSARGARLAVVTNKLTRLSMQVLDALDMSRFFDTVVCGDTTAQPKPAAEPALHACRELGLTPTQVLFVGDSDTDVGCARAAGCAVVCVPYGYNHGVPAPDLGADGVIESFLELI